jgi:TNF receptor-associated factor 2
MNDDILQVIALFLIRHIDSRYNCCYCKLLLRNACQTSCGCFVCVVCRSNLFIDLPAGDQTIQCPGKTEDCVPLTPDSIRIDNAKRREVLQTKIQCPFSNGKCTLMIIVSTLPQHYNECQFAQTKCPLCQESVSKEALLTHQRNDCLEGKATCPHCNVSLLRRELNEIHLNKRAPQCPNFTFLCAFCGEGPFNNQTIQQHGEVCNNWLSPCSFHEVGCQFSCRRTDMAQHEQEECASHIQFMADYYLKNNSKIIELKPKLANLKEQMKDTALEESYLKLVEVIERLNTRESSDIHLTNSSSSSIATSLRQHEENIENITNNLEFIRAIQWVKGYFVWKVDNFSRKRTEARDGSVGYIDSPSFYSPQIPSYRLRLRIYPNGREISSEPFLSIYFQFLPGEYDLILDWPFSGRILLEIVNPRDRNQNKKEYMRSDPSSPCFQKPTDNAGSQSAGNPRFISLHDLESNFLVNDTVYIACQVTDIR